MWLYGSVCESVFYTCSCSVFVHFGLRLSTTPESSAYIVVTMIALSFSQVFLIRIACHPVLSFNKNFSTFLTAKPWVSPKGLRAMMGSRLFYLFRKCLPFIGIVYHLLELFLSPISAIGTSSPTERSTWFDLPGQRIFP